MITTSGGGVVNGTTADQHVEPCAAPSVDQRIRRLLVLPITDRGPFDDLRGDEFVDVMCRQSVSLCDDAKRFARDHNFAQAWAFLGDADSLLCRSYIPDVLDIEMICADRRWTSHHVDIAIKVVEGLERHADRRRGR